MWIDESCQWFWNFNKSYKHFRFKSFCINTTTGRPCSQESGVVLWTCGYFSATGITGLGLKNTCGSGFPTDPIFSADPIIFSTRLTVQPYFLRAARTACQNGICCHNNYWTKLPKFVHRNYASLVNIDVGYWKSPSKKLPKPWKNIQKKLFPTYLP